MDTTNIILLVLIVVLVIAYPIMASMKNKKERQRFDEMANSIKRGDKIMTTSGIYGVVVDLHMEDDKKIVTIETGTGKNKGYMAFDMYAIYTVFPDENSKPQEIVQAKPAEESKAENDESPDKAESNQTESK